MTTLTTSGGPNRSTTAARIPTPYTTSVIDAYVYGFALTERNLPFDPATGANDFADEVAVEWDDYPHLAELVGELTSARDYSFAAEFEVGLDIILDELERRLDIDHLNGGAFGRGLGMTIGFGAGAGLLVAAVVLAASRSQLTDGGPGLLDVTVPVPALILLLVALLSTTLARSLRFGLEASAITLVTSLAALFTVLATEGTVWMNHHGVFILDGDPPRGVVDMSAVVFNLFSTGMWAGHLALWVSAALVGAALGAWIASRRKPTNSRGVPVPAQER